jgi:hypothetical protein
MTKQPTMSLQDFLDTYDKPGMVVLLEGKRNVPEQDQALLVAIGKLLASRTTHTLFRSGNASGADMYFKEGVLSVDPTRFQAIVPFNSHMKRIKEDTTSYSRISLDSINILEEPAIVYESKRNPKQKRLVDAYAGKTYPKLAKQGAYIVRDTLKVTGAPTQGISPASFGIFYDDLNQPKTGGTGHTMIVCENLQVPYVNQLVWREWLN